jgi:hypothetical protein
MTPDGGVTGQDGDRGFVVSSEVTISPESAETLDRAFRERLHLVEKARDGGRRRGDPAGLELLATFGLT